MLNIKRKHEINSEPIVALIVFHLVIMLIKNILVATSAFFFSYNSLLNSAIMVCLLLLYAYVFIKHNVFKDIPSYTILILCFLLLFVLLSLARHPDLFSKDGVLDQIRITIGYCIPLFVACSCVKNADLLFKKLFPFTYLLFLVATIGLVFSLQSKTHFNDYSMSYGYSVLFICLLLLFKYSYFRKPIDLLLFFASIIFIFLAGSRGPLIYIVIAIIFLFLTDNGMKNRSIKLVLLILVTIFLLFFYKNITSLIVFVLSKFGIESRTLVMLDVGNITNDSGRSAIFELLIEKINETPLIGVGAFGGEYTVYLSHNLFLDFFANFGYFFGSIILLIIIFMSIKCMIIKRNTLTFSFLGMMFILTFGGSFFSSSVFGTKELWILGGLIISILCRKRHYCITEPAIQKCQFKL